MSAEQISNIRLRELRDQVILYLYENASTEIGFALPESKVTRELGMTPSEMQAVQTVLHNFGLSGGRGAYIGCVNLSPLGLEEVEKLGKVTSLREPVNPPDLTIHAQNSVVQVAGSGSTQTASLALNTLAFRQLLDEVEAAVPSLKMEPTTAQEAKGLVRSLRQSAVSKMEDAGVRAIGTALANILTSAGSALGKSLLKLLGIA